MLLNLIDTNHVFSQEELKIMVSTYGKLFDDTTYILYNDDKYYCVFKNDPVLEQPFEIIKISANDYFPVHKIRTVDK